MADQTEIIDAKQAGAEAYKKKQMIKYVFVSSVVLIVIYFAWKSFK